MSQQEPYEIQQGQMQCCDPRGRKPCNKAGWGAALLGDPGSELKVGQQLSHQP